MLPLPLSLTIADLVRFRRFSSLMRSHADIDRYWIDNKTVKIT